MGQSGEKAEVCLAQSPVLNSGQADVSGNLASRILKGQPSHRVSVV